MTKCDSCTAKQKQKKLDTVPYLVHEAEMARNERHVKRLIISLVATIIMLFAANAAWLYAWCQYDYSGEEITVDASDGIANYIGNDGDITNGENYGP